MTSREIRVSDVSVPTRWKFVWEAVTEKIFHVKTLQQILDLGEKSMFDFNGSGHFWFKSATSLGAHSVLGNTWAME